MKTVTARVNMVVLNRGADLFFMGENVAVPFGQRSAKDLPAALDALGADAVVVEYRTISDTKAREQDRRKFSKRLDGLGSQWTRTDWTIKSVDGHPFPDTMVCTLSR